MRAEVTFLCRMIFRVDEDGVVRARGHARLTAYADCFVEINYAVRALEHRSRRTGRNARSVRALITPRHLMRSSRLRKHANVNVLHVSARHTERHFILRLAGRSAGVTANAARVVNHLRPLSLMIVGLIKG